MGAANSVLDTLLKKACSRTQKEARHVNDVIEDTREECKALQADNSLNTGSRPLFPHAAEARRIVKKLNRSQEWANWELSKIAKSFKAWTRTTEDQEGTEQYLETLANTHRRLHRTHVLEANQISGT